MDQKGPVGFAGGLRKLIEPYYILIRKVKKTSRQVSTRAC